MNSYTRLWCDLLTTIREQTLLHPVQKRSYDTIYKLYSQFPKCVFFSFLSFLISHAPGFLVIYFSFSNRHIDLETIFFTHLHFTLSWLFPQTNHVYVGAKNNFSLPCRLKRLFLTIFYTRHYCKVIIFVNTITMFPDNHCSQFDFTYNYT